jgi:UDP-GlcNAc:undecaprenyl-phosphate GlcNAc-1-phosphate transferase
MHYPFAWLFAVSFGATLVATPLVRKAGKRLGLLDHPHERKLQTSAVPRTGGIGVLVGLAAGTALLLHLSGRLGVPITREILAVFTGAVIIHATGVLDDLFDLPAGVKLAAQAFAVAVAVSQGVAIDRIVLPGGEIWQLGPLAMPATAFFLLGFVNTINLVDGLDGLAGGIVAIGALALGLAGVVQGNYVLASLSVILLGAVLGFLPFNFLREKTFLGDAGSMLLGYLLGVTAIAGAWFSGQSTSLVIGLAAAFVPILDTTTTIVRRFRNGRRLFEADSMHLHHRMVRAGLSPRRTVLTILAVTVFAAGQSLVYFVEGTRILLVTSTLAVALAALQVVLHRRPNPADPDDSGFRDIVLYLLGAQRGRGSLMDESVGMADVLAAVQAASRDARGNAGWPVAVPRPVEEVETPGR